MESLTICGIGALKKFFRPFARRLGLAAKEGEWWKLRRLPWTMNLPRSGFTCNICGWIGSSFLKDFHSEGADCPRCGSIARDRFLMHAFFSTIESPSNLRVLETSPRLGLGYRLMMKKHFDYTASDFDISAHEGDIQLDLQSIDLPSDSLDVVLTPHVLEHVPDTALALGELLRVLRPGGYVFLQIPLCQGTTSVPLTPEFHADNTLVFFRFGWDITTLIRDVGFEVDVLVTSDWMDVLRGDHPRLVSNGDGFAVEDLIDSAPRWIDVDADLVSIADQHTSSALGFLPPYHFVTWRCQKPHNFVSGEVSN